MENAASRFAVRIEEILKAYHKATVDLVEALARMDTDTACRAMEIRSGCVEKYAAEMDRLGENPATACDFPVLEKVRWHHLRINKADADAVRYIQSLQDEVRMKLVQVGLARKTERLYRPLSPDKSRIVNGES
jgi:hypothetical protein